MKLINTRVDDKTRKDNIISLPSSNFQRLVGRLALVFVWVVDVR